MISEYLLQENGIYIYVEVVRSQRRTIGLELKADGRAVLRIPKRLSDRSARAFLDQKRDWLFQKETARRKKAEQWKDSRMPAYEDLTASEKRKIRQKFIEKASYYGAEMGVSFGRVSVRNQRTRWGSCSSDGNLNFQYRLYYLPEELMDYVVIHELAHRRHMNHSPAFWAEVARICPDYKKRMKMLRQIPLSP